MAVATPAPVETMAMVRGFDLLKKVWDGLDSAARELSNHLGVPLCVEKCGLCCAANTPAASGIEVKRAASWLWSQEASARKVILDRIEEWLTRPVLDIVHPLNPADSVMNPQIGPPSGGRGRLMDREVTACLNGRCPLLGADMRCSVYDVRPLNCRGFGVTYQPATYCKRPQGRGESPTMRAYVGGPAAITLIGRVRQLFGAVRFQPNLVNWSMFPTALYREFRPQKFDEIRDQIPTAKMVSGENNPSIIFQAQTANVPLGTLSVLGGSR